MTWDDCRDLSAEALAFVSQRVFGDSDSEFQASIDVHHKAQRRLTAALMFPSSPTIRFG